MLVLVQSKRLTARNCRKTDAGKLTAFKSECNSRFDSYEMEGEDVEEKLLNMPKIKYFFSTKNVVTRACKLSN